MRNQILGLALVTALAACGSVKAGGSDAPEIVSFTPERSSAIGGTTITLTGFGLDDGSGVASVVVDGVLATDVTIVDDETVTFNTPPHESGTEAEIAFFNGDGTGRPEATLLYSNQPKVFSVDPLFGPIGGGTTLTITGVGFENFAPGDTVVTVGETAAASVTVVSDTELTATTAASTGTGFVAVDVEVSNANGAAALSAAFKFTKPGLLLTKRQFQDPAMVYLDLDSLEFVEIAPMNLGISALVEHADGTIYAATARDARNLVKLDPLTGEATEVGPIRSGASQRMPSDMAFIGNTLYGITPPNLGRELYSIDIGTGDATLVSATPLNTMNRSACIMELDANNLHMVNQLNGPLVTLSLADGAPTDTGITLDGPANVGCHGIFTIDGTTYVMSARPNGPEVATIYTLNLTNGAMTELVQVPFMATGIMETPSGF